MDDINKILEFLRIVIKMKTTYRFTPKEEGKFENDAEHSWSVAMVCMLLASKLEKEFNVELDTEKMLKMALIHDIAEVVTGDTKTWDSQSRVGKEEREREAIIQMTSGLPGDLKEEILALWEECERKETLEAKIVKSLDRLEAVIHRTLLDFGWKNLETEGENSTVEALDERQLARHSFSEVITELYTQVRDEAVKRDMFPKIK